MAGLQPLFQCLNPLRQTVYLDSNDNFRSSRDR
jgi:hypothetical protein